MVPHRVIVLVLFPVLWLLVTSALAGGEDLKLGGEEALTIEDPQVFGNVTLTGHSTLIINGTSMEIRGLLRMNDNSRLFVQDGVMVVRPPALDEHIMPVFIRDRSLLKASSGSDVVFHPQPSATNISYMLADDSSSFILVDSDFSFESPEIIDQSIELASVTSGVLLFSSSSSWTVIDSEIEAYLNVTPSGQLRSRWFWCTLHQNAKVELIDSEAWINTPLNTIFKPISGMFQMTRSVISQGYLDGEVTATFAIEDSEVDGLNLRDQSQMVLASSTVQTLTIGIIAPYTDVDEMPRTKATIGDVVVKGRTSVKGAATVDISGSVLDSLFVSEEAEVELFDSIVSDTLTCVDVTSVLGDNCSVTNLTVDDDCWLHLDKFGSATRMVMREGGPSTASLSNGTIDEISVYQDHTKTIVLRSVDVGNISFWDNVTMSIVADDSSIQAFRPWRQENIHITMSVSDSEVPPADFDENISVDVYHPLKVLVRVNGMATPADLRVLEESGVETVHVIPDGIGCVWFDVLVDTYSEGVLTHYRNVTVEATFLDFEGRKEEVMDSSKTVRFDWSDPYSPSVKGISHSPSSWNSDRDLFVTADVTDADCGAIRSVTLNYSVDGSPWVEVPMYETSPGTYKAMIPRQSAGSTVRYRVRASDVYGNYVVSDTRSLVVGEEEDLLTMSLFALMVVMALALLGRHVLRYRRTRRFLRGGGPKPKGVRK